MFSNKHLRTKFASSVTAPVAEFTETILSSLYRHHLEERNNLMIENNGEKKKMRTKVNKNGLRLLHLKNIPSFNELDLFSIHFAFQFKICKLIANIIFLKICKMKRN